MNNDKITTEYDLPPELAADWRGDALRKSARPDQFWHTQRMQIHSRVENPKVRRPRSLWLSMAAAAAVFVLVLLISPVNRAPKSSPPRPTVDADQELLLAVEHALASGTPEALEPLTLLVESSATSHDPEPISHKEQSHEN